MSGWSHRGRRANSGAGVRGAATYSSTSAGAVPALRACARSTRGSGLRARGGGAGPRRVLPHLLRLRRGRVRLLLLLGELDHLLTYRNRLRLGVGLPRDVRKLPLKRFCVFPQPLLRISKGNIGSRKGNIEGKKGNVYQHSIIAVFSLLKAVFNIKKLVFREILQIQKNQKMS